MLQDKSYLFCSLFYWSLTYFNFFSFVTFLSWQPMRMEDILAWLTITVHIIPSALETDARAAMSWLETEKHAKLVSMPYY